MSTSASCSISSESKSTSTDKRAVGVDTVGIFVTRVWRLTLIDI